ncbi:MAG TPA: M28 family metallopeptidase [Allosphingosinicella sp.]|nr:M28 family metallopeptidase [Allosphingosinicella sp.]
MKSLLGFSLVAPLLLAACTSIGDPGDAGPADRAGRWLALVQTLSSDAMEGRAAGTPGHQRAVDHVVAELQRLGLEPAGTDGFLQPVALVEQRIDYQASSASLTAAGAAADVEMPATMTVAAGRPLPESVDAPLVFIGYGLHIPQRGHDDLSGIDLDGKIAVFLSGGPEAIEGSAKAHARAQRTRLLAERGAVGSIDISTPSQLESPWASSVRSADRPAMFLADPALRSEPGPFLAMRWNPADAERLFAGSDRSFADIVRAADASGPIAGFDLNKRLNVRLATSRVDSTSPNVVARLPGRSGARAGEHVVLTAHLDGVGRSAAASGDAISNGALDNAAGVAALIDIAERLKRRRPLRSILFVFVTAEERGLLGSRYFARRPSVPARSIVANLNYDMALPIFPLTSVTVLGAEESSIGTIARQIGAEMGLPLVPDAFPNRNSFIRSDQYAFIEQGIPSAAFKFGFAADTPEAEIERTFRATRYHNLNDDLTIPIFPLDEIRLHDFIAELALRIANGESRPTWNAASVFARRP